MKRGFTKQEAQEKVGRLVRLKVGYPSVPEGTIGKVVEISTLSSNGWSVAIQWEGNCKRFQLWSFSKYGYEQNLEEV
jgi:hypothetical protein